MCAFALHYAKETVMASAGASGHSTMTPSCNRLLQKKWDDKRLYEHKERLRTMKASVDNQPPRDFVHLKQNRRKRQVEEDRLAVIDRHNHELLSRMHHIMHTTGRVDHRNQDWRPKRSLSYIKRQGELARIQRENQAILKRIQTVRPQYKVKDWESEFRVHQARTKKCSLPPIQSSSPPKPKPEQSAPSKLVLPPINQASGRPETQPSEVQEEIDMD